MLPQINQGNPKKKEIYKRIKLLGEGNYGNFLIFSFNLTKIKRKSLFS